MALKIVGNNSNIKVLSNNELLKLHFELINSKHVFKPGDLVTCKHQSLVNSAFLRFGENAIVIGYTTNIIPFNPENNQILEIFDIILGINVSKERYEKLIDDIFEGDLEYGSSFFEFPYDSRRLKLAE